MFSKTQVAQYRRQQQHGFSLIELLFVGNDHRHHRLYGGAGVSRGAAVRQFRFCNSISQDHNQRRIHLREKNSQCICDTKCSLQRSAGSRRSGRGLQERLHL